MYKWAVSILMLQVLVSGASAENSFWKADWDNLKRHGGEPEWVKDSKFGIFLHFLPGAGAMPVPEKGVAGDWYARLMYMEDNPVYTYHQKVWGNQKDFGFVDLVTQFKAEGFDADEWCDLFQEAGAKFVVPVGEHHDHFAMWDSDLTEWCSTKVGPMRDVVGELEQATRARNMYFGISNHRARGLTFYTYKDEFDTVDPAHANFYTEIGDDKYWTWKEALVDWEARLVEQVEKYNPDMFWFDYGWNDPRFEEYKKRFIAYYYNHGITQDQEVAVTYKGQHLPFGVGLYDIERGSMVEATPFFWMTDTSISEESWSYIEGMEIHDVKTELDLLVDIVSKNGALLLNIAPRGDGIIPENQKELLRGIGAWLKVQGEGVYKSRPWQIAEEGGVRFTRRGKYLYAFLLDVDADSLSLETLGLEDMGGLSIAQAEWVDSNEAVSFIQNDSTLELTLSGRDDENPIPTLRLELAGSGCINFHPELSYNNAGFSVNAKGTVVNFSDETVEGRPGRCHMFADKGSIGNGVQLNLKPGEERNVHFEHSDLATYGATAAVVNGDQDLIELSFGFAKKRSQVKRYLLPGLGLQGEWNFTYGEVGAGVQHKVRLPGSWSSKEGREGWARRSFYLPKGLEGVALKLTMSVIDPYAEIYINGHTVGVSDISIFEHAGGHQPSIFQLDPAILKFGAENEVALHIQASEKRKRFQVQQPLPSISIYE